MSTGCNVNGMYTSRSQGDEDSIYEAVGTIGPVSICFDVTAGFQFYSHGVYSRFVVQS